MNSDSHLSWDLSFFSKVGEYAGFPHLYPSLEFFFWLSYFENFNRSWRSRQTTSLSRFCNRDRNYIKDLYRFNRRNHWYILIEVDNLLIFESMLIIRYTSYTNLYTAKENFNNSKRHRIILKFIATDSKN